MKKAHEELQRIIQKLRADELAYLKFLYKERPKLQERAYSETDPAARQKAREELQKAQQRLGLLSYKLVEPDLAEWEQ